MTTATQTEGTKLTLTNGGNWAKQITITGGGKWSFVGNFGSLASAEAAAEIQRAKGRKCEVVETETSKSQASKQRKLAKNWEGDKYIGPEVGKVFWRVEAYIASSRQVMTHASKAECEAAGKVAGPMNE